MRKILTLVGIGFLTLAGLLFFAEQKRASAEGFASLNAIRDVLRAQNQAFAGRLFEGLGRADQDALAALNRFRKPPKGNAFVSDTSLTEPEAPKWAIVAGRHLKAAGVADDALLEDALEAHLKAPARLAAHQSQGKYYLFIKGMVEGQPYASAYVPEAFFAGLRSQDGLRAWVALADGTVIYHPVPRFLGTNAANLKPVAAGIAELNRGSSAPYVSRYLSLEGSEALGALTPLPSFGALVATEWPKLPHETNQASAFFWFALGASSLGLLLLGAGFGGRSSDAAPEAAARVFDESQLDADSLDYLDEVRAASERAIRAAEQRAQEADEARRESHDALNQVGAIEWKSRVTEDFLDRVLPKVSGKQVWESFAQFVTRHSPEVSALVYRYSPSSYSLTPEYLHSRADLPETAVAYLKDARIFVGKPELLEGLVRTEAFQRWNKSRERQMPLQQTAFRVVPLGGAGAVGPAKGVLVLFFDERLNAQGELQLALGLFESLARRTATFCDSLPPLLHSTDANGSARSSVASAPNQPGNRPRPS